MIGLAQFVKGSYLDGGKAFADGLASCVREPFRRTVCDVAVDVGIEPDSATERTAEQGVDGNTQPLSEDVPQRLLDRAERGPCDPSAIETSKILPDPLDLEGRPPDQAFAEHVNRCEKQSIV